MNIGWWDVWIKGRGECPCWFRTFKIWIAHKRPWDNWIGRGVECIFWLGTFRTVIKKGWKLTTRDGVIKQHQRLVHACSLTSRVRHISRSQSWRLTSSAHALVQRIIRIRARLHEMLFQKLHFSLSPCSCVMFTRYGSRYWNQNTNSDTQTC